MAWRKFRYGELPRRYAPLDKLPVLPGFGLVQRRGIQLTAEVSMEVKEEAAPSCNCESGGEMV